MVRIRLTRRGAKKQPFYRVIAADQRARRDGRFIEQLGYYNPMNKAVFKLDLERIDHWLGLGAQPTDTVKALIAKYRAAQAEAPAADDAPAVS
jgi:small subunit ribosomal protein S16